MRVLLCKNSIMKTCELQPNTFEELTPLDCNWKINSNDRLISWLKIFGTDNIKLTLKLFS